MNSLIRTFAKSGLFKSDLDYHLVRASMVLIFLLFGYQKWFAYEAETLIPFMPDGWDAAAGFPAMKGNVAFLMKDAVLLAVSFYLLKQDIVRASRVTPERGEWAEVGELDVHAAEQMAAK